MHGARAQLCKHWASSSLGKGDLATFLFYKASAKLLDNLATTPYMPIAPQGATAQAVGATTQAVGARLVQTAQSTAAWQAVEHSCKAVVLHLHHLL